MQEFNVLDGGRSAGGFSLAPSGAGEAKSLSRFCRSQRRRRFCADVSGGKDDFIFLSAARDGLEQVARYLCGRARLSQIHLLADFSLGRLALGDKVLVVRSLRDDMATLARIGRAVSGGGEIVIGAGGLQDGQGENFRRIFEAYAAVPGSALGWPGATARLVIRPRSIAIPCEMTKCT